MLSNPSFFFLLCLWVNLILPSLEELRLEQKHVCRSIMTEFYEARLENCPSVLDMYAYEQCRNRLNKEWNTPVCCYGYVEVGVECKRKFLNARCCLCQCF